MLLLKNRLGANIMKRVLNSIIVSACAFTAGFAVAHALCADGNKAKTKQKGKVNDMANNDGKRKAKNPCATEKATGGKQQNAGKFSWNKIIRIKADKTAVVKPAIAYGTVIGVFALAIIIALIVIL